MTVRNPYLALIALVGAGIPGMAGCGGSASNGTPVPTVPPPVVCASVSGAWHTSWVMTPCGPDAQGGGDVVVSQTGCSVTFAVAGLGIFSGTLEGNESKPNLSLQFAVNAPGASPACHNVSEGGLKVQTDGSIDIPFGTDPAPCCRHGDVTLRR